MIQSQQRVLERAADIGGYGQSMMWSGVISAVVSNAGHDPSLDVT